jgi:hypothetical protein
MQPTTTTSATGRRLRSVGPQIVAPGKGAQIGPTVVVLVTAVVTDAV